MMFSLSSRKKVAKTKNRAFLNLLNPEMGVMYLSEIPYNIIVETKDLCPTCCSFHYKCYAKKIFSPLTSPSSPKLLSLMPLSRPTS